MITLFGQGYSDLDLRRYFGDSAVVAGARRVALREGKARGTELTQVSTGTGLVYEVNESRGMDLGRCVYKGIPISYQSYDKEVHPSYFEPYGDNWLSAYGGGLMVSCGLRSTGAPCEDSGETLPLHGRLSSIPAECVNIKKYTKGMDSFINTSGVIRESKALNFNLVVRRSITSKVGSNEIYIEDEIENEGFERQDLMLLYHFNVGHPILDEGSRFYSNSESVEPRDEVAESQQEPYDEYLAPTPHYGDVVYYHKLRPRDGICTVGITNKRLNLGLELDFRRDELDCFTQWKFTGEGNYVAGLEPGNAFVSGRSVERAQGRLKCINPQEKKHVGIMVRILTTDEEISRVEDVTCAQGNK